MAANSLKANNSWLGDYFRRMKSKGGHKYPVGNEAFHIVEGRYEAAVIECENAIVKWPAATDSTLFGCHPDI